MTQPQRDFFTTPDEYTDLLQSVAQRCWEIDPERQCHPEDLGINYEVANAAIVAVVNWYTTKWRREERGLRQAGAYSA